MRNTKPCGWSHFTAVSALCNNRGDQSQLEGALSILRANQTRTKTGLTGCWHHVQHRLETTRLQILPNAEKESQPKNSPRKATKQ